MAAILMAGSLFACGGESEPPVPASIILSNAAITFHVIGETQQLTTTITDQRGDPLPDATVSWTSTDEAVAAVSNAGFVTACGAGQAQVTAAAGEVTAIADVSVVTAVEPTPGITALDGNGQSAAAGQAVPIAPAVRVLDGQNRPLAGIGVSFQVTGGGGSVSGGQTTTNACGIATVGSWIIGTGGVNTLTATADEAGLNGNPVTFVATTDAATGFNIKTRFVGSGSTAQLIAFAEAELRWEELVTGDLADVSIAVPATDCSPAVDETVDDLIIYATLQPIDGPGNVLGAAGPCYIRITGELSIIGRMFFDTADLELIENNNLLGDVILHEMGHVLGFGTLWEEHELLADKSLTEPPGVDPHFTGTQAIAAFNAAGGNTYTGAKVPVENTGGAGTADVHWRDDVFDNELMTGFVNLGVNPLSRITVASLADMGYVVNLPAADSYTLAPGLRIAGSRQGLHLKNDVIRGPIRRVDASGRIVGVLSR